MTFKGINELVEQNVQLRGQVRCLSAEVEKKDAELRVGIKYFFHGCCDLHSKATSVVDGKYHKIFVYIRCCLVIRPL